MMLSRKKLDCKIVQQRELAVIALASLQLEPALANSACFDRALEQQVLRGLLE
jgi:hypothetical protein